MSTSHTPTSVSSLQTLSALSTFFRLHNSLLTGLLLLIGAYITGAYHTYIPEIILATLIVICTTSAGNALNDYFDQDIDAINNPNRPLPRGTVTPQQVLYSSICLFTLSLTLSVFLPIAAFALVVLNTALLIAYTPLFKHIGGIGNAIVAYLSGSVFLLPGLITESLPLVATLATLAALVTFSREILKDIEDINGDAQQNLHTLPIKIGTRNAAYIATASLFIALAILPFPVIFGDFNQSFLLFVTPGIVVIISGLATTWNTPTTGHKTTKFGMFLAAIGFIAAQLYIG